MNDLPQYRTPWTCKVIGRNTPVPSPPAPAAPASDGKCVPSYTVNCVPAEKRNGLLRGGDWNIVVAVGHVFVRVQLFVLGV